MVILQSCLALVKNKRRLLWWLALLSLSTLATVLTLSEINDFKTRLASQGAPQGELIEVLAVDRALRPGAVVDRTVLQAKPVPLAVAKMGLVRAIDAPSILGRRSPVALQKGDLLLAAMFEGSAATSLKDFIRPGYRLLPINDARDAVGGLIEGTEHVDIWDTSAAATLDVQQDLSILEAGREAGRARLIAQRLRVVALAGAETDTPLLRVFLEAKEHQVPEILQAQQSGRIRYVATL
mgnify:CR=1 FL=1